MAATAIGTSHLVLSPVAGARFGYELIWLVLFSHLFKYPAFEFGPRYAAATGQHLLQGYLRVPGPRGWPLILFLVTTLLTTILVMLPVTWTYSATRFEAGPSKVFVRTLILLPILYRRFGVEQPKRD